MVCLLTGMDNNPLFYVLIILLILIVVAIFYLVYTQNKEIIKLFGHKDKEEIITGYSEDLLMDTVEDNGEMSMVEEINEIEDDIYPEERTELLTATEDEIPNKFDYTQALWQKDEFDLEALSQELENHSNKRQSIASKYEEEQEEEAIISYDELVNKKNNEIEIPFELPKKKEDIASSKKSYEHEEKYLNELKKLKDVLK